MLLTSTEALTGTLGAPAGRLLSETSGTSDFCPVFTVRVTPLAVILASPSIVVTTSLFCLVFRVAFGTGVFVAPSGGRSSSGDSMNTVEPTLNLTSFIVSSALAAPFGVCIIMPLVGARLQASVAVPERK